ncbi:hypothetical protein Q1695_001967 [Nippostrongylus brasiliensis]|nr:hypothetical protein Q1695_001967 [Nippostrongylus brasiliensis]
MEHPQMTGDVAGYTGYCSQQKPVPQGFRRVGANYLIRYSNAPLTLTRANGIVFNLQNKDGGRARRPLLCDNVYPTTSYTPFSSAPSYTLPNTVQASLSNSSSGYKILYNNVEADQSKTVHLMPIDNRGVQLIIPLSQPVQPVDHGKAIPPTETTYSLLSPPMSSRPSPAAQFSNGSEEFTLLEGSGYPSSSISVTPPAEKPTSLENDIDYALLDEFFVKQEQWH